MLEKDKLIAIVEGVQKGDSDAAAQLYTTFEKDIYYYIFKTVNDSELAADLTQDTFIEILETISTLQEPAAFVTWSRKIAYHKCTAYFRKRKELLADEDEDGYSVFDTAEEDRTEFLPAEALDKADLRATIARMINDLPEVQRNALVLRYFDELSVQQIAEIQGVSEGTVKSRLNYGRKAMKEAVETYEKKNGVKLHCVGVVPLLLWFFRQSRRASAAAATPAAAAASASASASAFASASASVAKAAAKTAGKFAFKKLIAGIAAAILVAGGATTAVVLKDDPAPEPDPTPVATSTPDPSPYLMTGAHFYGTGTDSFYAPPQNEDHFFYLIVYGMTDSTVSGQLIVSYDGAVDHITDFTGSGAAENGIYCFDILLENFRAESASSENITLRLEYDPSTGNITFPEQQAYTVTLKQKNSP